jgi:hypothetical protein
VFDMKTQWVSAVVLSAAFAASCGGDGREDTQNINENDGTTVALAPEAGEATAQTPTAGQPLTASPDVDSAPVRRDSSTARPATEARRSSPAPAPRPADRTEPQPSRAAEPAAPVVRSLTIPAGTPLALELTSAVSTETASVEMPVSARLRRDVDVDGVTVLPAGAVVDGEVIDVERPGRVQGRARLGLRFTSVTVDGRREDIRTNPVMFEGEATKREDATKIGAGAGIGAVIGGIVGGGSGAAKGAAIGGAAGTGAVLATRGRDVELGPGADVNATLASATTVDVR